MGGELGSFVAQLLEPLAWVGDVVGLDVDPPRLRLRHAHFHRVTPGDHEAVATLVRELDPDYVVHLGVYEPDARCNPAEAARFTWASADDVLRAAAAAPSLKAVVVRSGLEVYGRRHGAPAAPDETVAPEPTSPFGRSLLEVERLALATGRARDVPVTLLRFANLVGGHFPSPLGRCLRLPVVPFNVLGDHPFCLLHRDDAARTVVAALEVALHGPVNVAGDGVVTARRAARMGGRCTAPVAGPGWRAARGVCALVGAPLPDHLHELLTRGRAADLGRLHSSPRMVPRLSTVDVVKDLYAWASVTHLRPDREAA